MKTAQLENGYTKLANEIIDALSKIRISGEAMQCLFHILRKTYGWNKKSDKISISSFVLHTGIRKPGVIRALKKLQSMSIIIIKKDTSYVNEYLFNKDFSSWKPLSKKIQGVSKKIMGGIKKDTESGIKNDTLKINIKDTITKDSMSHVSDYPQMLKICEELKLKIDGLYPNRYKLDLDKGCKIIHQMMRLDKHDINEIELLVNWYPIGDDYIPEIRSFKSLREKYDKLYRAFKRNKYHRDNQTEKQAEIESERYKKENEQAARELEKLLKG